MGECVRSIYNSSVKQVFLTETNALPFEQNKKEEKKHIENKSMWWNQGCGETNYIVTMHESAFEYFDVSLNLVILHVISA